MCSALRFHAVAFETGVAEAYAASMQRGRHTHSAMAMCCHSVPLLASHTHSSTAFRSPIQPRGERCHHHHQAARFRPRVCHFRSAPCQRCHRASAPVHHLSLLTLHLSLLNGSRHRGRSACCHTTSTAQCACFGPAVTARGSTRLGSRNQICGDVVVVVVVGDADPCCTASRGCHRDPCCIAP
jgi:hypothetical protein